jgi:hypothetical protein
LLNSILTLTIAVLGLVVALFTYVLTVASNPRLSVVMGQRMHMHYTANKARLIVTTDYVFLNGGAQPGALIDLSGIILLADGGKQFPIAWERFEESKNVSGQGLQMGSSDLVRPLIVPGRTGGSGGVEKTIRLYTPKDHPFELKKDAGEYSLKLTGVEGSKLARRYTVICRLHVKEHHARYLSGKMCTEYHVKNQNDQWDDRLILLREPVPKESMMARMGRRLLKKPPMLIFTSYDGEKFHISPQGTPEPPQ